MGFVHTGSPSKVIALSWDKGRVKRRLERRKVLTPRWQIFETPEASGWSVFPAIVKPAFEHASLGLCSDAVVLDPEALRRRVAYVIESFGQPAVVEEFVDGREFHVSLWGNGLVEVLPPAEMDFGAFDDVRDRLCSYDAKFTPGSRHYDLIQLRLPASLTPAELGGLERAAKAAYEAVGCRDYGRLDIRLRDGRFYVLDVNPNADISADASMACAAEVAGYSFGEMLGRLVELATLRHPQARCQGHAQPGGADQ
jgi:D-alanine-D-alanine ligase